MMHRAWSIIVEVPYCFSRSSVKFQGHTALKIVEFDPNWPFPDCNSSLNSTMAMKYYTKLETAKERCPIVFQGHPSNFKVTQDITSPILTQIGRSRTLGRSQLSNPSDLPCCFKITHIVEVWCICQAMYVKDLHRWQGLIGLSQLWNDIEDISLVHMDSIPMGSWGFRYQEWPDLWWCVPMFLLSGCLIYGHKGGPFCCLFC